MPAIKNFILVFALLPGACSIALAGQYRADASPRHSTKQDEPYAAQRAGYPASQTNERRYPESRATKQPYEEPRGSDPFDAGSRYVGQQSGAERQPASRQAAPQYNEPSESDARYSDGAAEQLHSAEQPQRRPRQLPVRFEPSTRRLQKSAVVQASAVEPVAEPPKPAATLADEQPEKTLKLSPQSAGSRSQRNPASTQSLVTMGGSLAIVVGLFLLVAWVMRRGMPKGSALVPREALEVLGRAPLAGKHQVHLLRCGNKILLVSVTAVGVETLTEITDPVEVDRISGLCQQSRRGSSTKAFQQVLSQFEQEPAPPSFTGDKLRSRLDLSAFESIGKSKRREGLDG